MVVIAVRLPISCRWRIHVACFWRTRLFRIDRQHRARRARYCGWGFALNPFGGQLRKRKCGVDARESKIHAVEQAARCEQVFVQIPEEKLDF